jgi:hypothetical protein
MSKYELGYMIAKARKKFITTFLLATAFFVMLIFLIALLVFSLIGVDFQWSFAVALLGFVIILLKNKSPLSALKTLEEGNPGLREKLRTANDNKGKSNVIVDSLVEDVRKDLKSFDNSAFFDVKKTSSYIFLSIILVFLLLSMMFVGFEGMDISIMLGSSSSSDGASGGGGSGAGGSGSGGAGEDTDPQGGLGSASADIYGAPSIAIIEGQEISMEIHPEYGGESGVGGESTSSEAVNVIRSSFVYGSAAESYSENIPVQLEEVVRSYFEKVTAE